MTTSASGGYAGPSGCRYDTERRPLYHRQPVRCSVVLLAALTISGCSLLTAKRPPHHGYERIEDVDCTETVVPPVADAVITAGLVAATTVLWTRDPHEGKRIVDLLGGVATAVAALPFAASSVVGFFIVADCQEAAEQIGEQPSEGGEEREGGGGVGDGDGARDPSHSGETRAAVAGSR